MADQQNGGGDGPGVDRRVVELMRAELGRLRGSDRRRLTEKLALAALGSIPWVGGFAGAVFSYTIDQRKARTDDLQTHWLEEYSHKLDALMRDLRALTSRIDALGAEGAERAESEPYLALVRRAFRVWDRADTAAKKLYVGNLLAGAAATRTCSDDVVRLFIDWLDLFHDAHLAVVQRIFRAPGITRREIWKTLYGEPPREDSPDADLYRLLMRDLGVGGVIRQERATTADGQFVRRPPARVRPRSSPPVLESAFDDTRPYRLTALGEQFVRYAMPDDGRAV